MTESRPYLKPIKNKSVVQQVVDGLTQALIEKTIRPGDRIPPEQDLADMFGVSRNSVREAIKILVSFGVLEIKRPEGTFVTKGISDSMIDPLLYGIILEDSESLGALKELREWIDIGIIRLNIIEATDKDIQALKAALAHFKEMTKTEDVEAVFEADNAFHEALSIGTHNSLFAKVAAVTRLLTKEIRYKTIRHMTRNHKLEELYDVHQELYCIIKGRVFNDVEKIIQKSYFYDEGALEE